MQAENSIENIKVEKKVDSFGRAYSTGKRKSSIARVWIKAGNGSVVVNGRKKITIFHQNPTDCFLINRLF